MKKSLAVLALVAGVLCATLASAQDRPGRGRAVPPGAAEEGVSPAEIQRLFDAYVVMQAQQELQLTDDQFPRFLARVRTLQDVRRRGQMQRGRMLQELRRLSQNGQDEQIRTMLRRLNELDASTATEIAQAIEAVDQVLDLRQQARFRLLEEQMERRKMDLLMRARQANRPRNQF